MSETGQGGTVTAAITNPGTSRRPAGTPVTALASVRIRRTNIPGGPVHEYQQAARRSAKLQAKGYDEFWNPSGWPAVLPACLPPVTGPFV